MHITESRHPDSHNLDQMPTVEVVRLMNQEDARVVDVVSQALPAIAALVDKVAEQLRSGGRLFYVGAGTSGRLGVLDASECPPTFGTDPEMVQGILAGGLEACVRAVEHAEDDPEAAASELCSRGLDSRDVVVGISASGRTPYALGAVRYARDLGVPTGSICCNSGTPLSLEVDFPIVLEVGAEVLTGSTRLKAGTATKMALNMISTAAMVRLGRVLGNLMVDLRPNSQKLQVRQVRNVAEAARVSQEVAASCLEQAQGNVRLASVMAAGGLTPAQADELLKAHNDLREALEVARSRR